MKATQLLKKKPIQTWDCVSSGDEIIKTLFAGDVPCIWLMRVRKNLLVRKVFNYEENDSFVYYKPFSLYLDNEPVLFCEETHLSKRLYVYKEESFNDLIRYVMEEFCRPAKFIRALEPNEDIPVNKSIAELKLFYDGSYLPLK